MMLSRRKVLQGGAALATVGAASGFNRRAARAQSGPIKLPIMMSLSGPLSVVGLQGKLGAELTIKVINSNGGILGRNLEPIFFDDKGRPADLIAAAREALSLGFNYIGGGLVSAHFGGLAPVLAESKAVLVTAGGSAPFLTNDQFSRYIFPGSENDLQRANVLAQVAAQKFPEARNFGSAISEAQSFIESYANFTTYAKRFYSQLGKEPKFTEAHISKIGTTDFRTQLSRIAASDIDAFYNFTIGSDGITFWKQAAPFNLAEKFKLVVDQTIDFPQMKALKKDLPPKLWSLMMWYHGLHNDNEMSREVYKEYVAQTGDHYPSGYLFYGNVCVCAMAEMLKRNGGQADTETLINTLETTKFQTLKGEVYFRREDHLLIGNTDVVNVVRSEEEPGFRVADSVSFNTLQYSPPPNPGKPYRI